MRKNIILNYFKSKIDKKISQKHHQKRLVDEFIRK